MLTATTGFVEEEELTHNITTVKLARGRVDTLGSKSWKRICQAYDLPHGFFSEIAVGVIPSELSKINVR